MHDTADVPYITVIFIRQDLLYLARVLKQRIANHTRAAKHTSSPQEVPLANNLCY